MRMYHRLIAVILFLAGLSGNAWAQKYTVRVTFLRITCLKVVEAPFDTKEDLYGYADIPIYVMKDQNGVLKRNGTIKTTPDFYNNLTQFPSYVAGKFGVVFPESGPRELGKDESLTVSKLIEYKDLTYDQLMSFEFLLGGAWTDNDLFDAQYNICTTCGFSLNNMGFTLYRRVKMRDYKTQIDNIPNRTEANLKIGDDDIMELHYYEKDTKGSHIRLDFRIRILKY